MTAEPAKNTSSASSKIQHRESFFLGLHFWFFDVDFFFPRPQFRHQPQSDVLSCCFLPLVLNVSHRTSGFKLLTLKYLYLSVWKGYREPRECSDPPSQSLRMCDICWKKKPLKYEWTFHALGLGTFIPRPSKANGFTLRVDVIVSRKKKKTSFTRRAFRAAVVRL